MPQNLSAYDRQTLDEFLNSVKPGLAGFKHARFSYFAIREGDGFVLSQGHLHLRGEPLAIPSGCFESENIKAGSFSLVEAKQTPQGIIDFLLSSKLETPHGDLNFPINPQQGNPYSLHFNPFLQEGIQSQRRVMQLVISGRPRQHPNFGKLNWELKAATTPYDNIQDLCNEYAVGNINGDTLRVEVVAQNVVAIDGNSVVKDSKAHLTLILAEGLDQNNASIGFRIFDKNKVTKREQIPGSKLKWTKDAIVQRGSVELEVPSGAVLQCFANYAGETHQYFWVADPSTAPNPRRAVHQAFDDKMEILQELLKIQGKGINSRDFESAVSWLLWMLGFSVTHIGGTQRTSGFLDLIATTPQGHFLVVECTTGLLKADNKLPKLVERAEKVKRNLVNSGNGHLKVLCVRFLAGAEMFRVIRSFKPNSSFNS